MTETVDEIIKAEITDITFWFCQVFVTMEIKQQYSSNVKKSVDPDSLKVVKNIRFTDREIDVIACLIGGKSYKRIASILSISPKTVEYHVRNIMLRIGYNSREGIIDFIEKSDKFTLIKGRYGEILAKTSFEQELKRLSSIIKENDINCLIFHDESKTTKASFICQLEQHLNTVGIETLSKIWVKDKSKDFLINKGEVKQINCIIYVLSSTFIKQLQETGCKINEEASSLIPLIKEGSSPIVFLLLDDEASLDIDKDQPNFVHISLAESGNYYFLFFELLKKIIPNNIIDTNIIKFKKQYEIFQSNYKLQEWTGNSNLATEQDDIKDNKQEKKNKYFKWLMPFCVLLIGFGVFALKINTKDNEKNNTLIRQLQSNQSNIASNKQNTLLENRQKNIIFNLPPRNSKFIGREDSLDQIKKQLNKQKIGIITQAISGSGGIGKTQLAAEFAYRAFENKDYGIILWINAESSSAIDHTYRELANILQVDIGNLELGKAQALLHRKLAEIYIDSSVLFILDNVPNYDSIQSYMGSLHKQFIANLPLHILITSRSQHWPERPLVLDIFTAKEAKIFIEKHLPNGNDNSIIELAKTLYYFPLALSQAVAYIKKHTSIDDYLKLYANKKKDFLNKFSGDRNQYTESLWKTWHISLSELSDNAEKMLFISAYLYPDNIPIVLFSELSIEERGEAIKKLREYSFVIPTSNKSFKIHRLLQEVLQMTPLTGKHASNLKEKIIVKKQKQHLRDVISIVESYFKHKFNQESFHKGLILLIPHLESLLDHSNSIFMDEELKLYKARILYMLTMCYKALGNLRMSNYYLTQNDISFLKNIVKTNASFFKKSNLNISKLSISMLKELCNYKIYSIRNDKVVKDCLDSIELAARSKQINDKNKLIIIVECLKNIGRFYLLNGRFSQAKSYYEQALLKLVNSSDTSYEVRSLWASIYKQLAKWYLYSLILPKEIRIKEAQKYITKTLKLLEAEELFYKTNELPPSSLMFRIASIRIVYGDMLNQIGRCSEAKSLGFDEAKYLVNSYPEVSNSLELLEIAIDLGIAEITLRNGRLEEAENELTRIVKLAHDRLLERSGQVEKAISLRIEAKNKQGKLKEAYEDCQIMFDMGSVKNNFYYNSLLYNSTHYHAAVIKYKQGDLRKSLKHFNSFFEKMKSFCESFLNKSDYEKGIYKDVFNKIKTTKDIDLCFQKALRIFTLVYGESHPFIKEYVRKNANTLTGLASKAATRKQLQ